MMEKGRYSYHNVKKWTRHLATNISALDVLVIPIHKGTHWVCVVAFMKKKRICFYDSLGGSGKHYLKNIRKYIGDELTCNDPGMDRKEKKRKGKELMEGWVTRYVHRKIDESTRALQWVRLSSTAEQDGHRRWPKVTKGQTGLKSKRPQHNLASIPPPSYPMYIGARLTQRKLRTQQ